MPLLSWLADRLILCPTVHPIEAGDEKRREVIPVADSFIEAWVGEHVPESNFALNQLAILKFPGTAGRAERAGVHPAEMLRRFQSEIWTINLPGYGGSPGAASIKKMADCASASYSFVSEKLRCPVLVSGNSLGCLSALYVAANFSVAGLILRNPPPIHELIRTRPRYAAWSLGLSKWIANEVPRELDAVKNATTVECPCLFVQSEQDKVVPTKYQDLIINQFKGQKKVLVIPGADHHEPLGDEQMD
ncbi:MAG: alpha/beta hydrolase, partial [Planctomycetota bacterium]